MNQNFAASHQLHLKDFQNSCKIMKRDKVLKEETDIKAFVSSLSNLSCQGLPDQVIQPQVLQLFVKKILWVYFTSITINN